MVFCVLCIFVLRSVERFRLRVRSLQMWPSVQGVGRWVPSSLQESVRADCFKCVWCPYLRVSEHRSGMYPSESVGVFVEELQVQRCWRALFSDRARLDALFSLVAARYSWVWLLNVSAVCACEQLAEHLV